MSGVNGVTGTGPGIPKPVDQEKALLTRIINLLQPFMPEGEEVKLNLVKIGNTFRLSGIDSRVAEKLPPATLKQLPIVTPTNNASAGSIVERTLKF